MSSRALGSAADLDPRGAMPLRLLDGTSGPTSALNTCEGLIDD